MLGIPAGSLKRYYTTMAALIIIIIIIIFNFSFLN